MKQIDWGTFSQTNNLSEKSRFKGALTRYGKLTWESAHAYLVILRLLIAWGITFIFMHLSFYAIPLIINDVVYDVTTSPEVPSYINF